MMIGGSEKKSNSGLSGNFNTIEANISQEITNNNNSIN